MLQTLLQIVSIAAVHANTSFKVLTTVYLTFRIYLAARHYYGHVAAICVLF